jgi:ubiquinone/menaquinone biosynthesis C-methylase UbiE
MKSRALVMTLALAAACDRTTSERSPQPPAQTVPPTVSSSAPPVASSVPTPPAPPDPPGTYLGRTLAKPMSHLGADWLDRAGRDDVQKPEHVLDVLHVSEGQSVADVGCGSGYFTVHLARRVGARGRVFASDLQPEMLALLKKKTDAQKITNVTPVLATEDDAKLPKGALDLILLVDVYHELPKPAATLAQFKEALSSKGVLALVEYRAEDPKVAIKPEHKMTLAQIKKELAANGWTFVASEESLPEQRIVTFTR